MAEVNDTDFLYPETAAEALAKWDSGASVFTVEMGGLGPGYEQRIHIVVFELIRAFKDLTAEELDKVNIYERFDESLFANPIINELGLSGAQAGAGKNLAWHVLRRGWREAIKSVGSDRHIQVSKYFPQAEARP